MTDLIFNTGPVMTSALREVLWRQPTGIVDLECRGGDCGVLAHSLEDQDGLVMPGLIRRYGPASRVALSGFSAGGYFMNPVLKHPADRALVDAVIAMDAAFASEAFDGYAAFGAEAARGGKLFVITTGPHPNAWNAVRPTWDAIEQLSGLRSRPVSRVRPMPDGAEFVQQIGEGAVWYHYPSIPHSGTTYNHFDMMADAWQAYLVRWNAPKRWPGLVAGASLATLSFAAALTAQGVRS